jgi:hypothetical protein
MLTLKECRKLVDPKNEKYTDEQLLLMLEFQLELAQIIVDELKLKANEEESSIDVACIQR